MYHLGVDTGGTFTDFVLFDQQNRQISAFKVRSQPSDPGQPIEAGLARLKMEYGVPVKSLTRFIYGTTVATNAVLELKGAKTALLTTRGIRDVLEIQRQWRNRLFDLYLRKPAPLVPRRWRLEVDERVTAKGEVLIRLSDQTVNDCLETLEKLPVEAVAIVFLFSFLQPDHEQRLAAAIRARYPHLHVAISSEVSPEFREYERTATTVMNAYTMPVIERLARRLHEVLMEAGFRGSFGVIQSNGGLMSLEKAQSHPVNTLLSGPAGGVVGAAAVARQAKISNILTMDIGGTSTDIALVEGTDIRLNPEGGIGGYPVRVPQVSVHTIGAGGGSIARSELGALKVGPQSAGAHPGPACYGQGGSEPTSTDAALCLGYIDPNYFLGGEMSLDLAAAENAIREKVAKPFNLSLAEAALAIVRVQVSNIVAGIRKVSVESGYDPRDFSLLPFGGAGGLYAGLIAEDMGLRRIAIPQYPSVLSALGMLMTNVKHTRSTTRVIDVAQVDERTIEMLLAELADKVADDFADDHIYPENIIYEHSLDLRYVGQAYEINLRLAGAGREPVVRLSKLRSNFHREHRRLYGHSAESEPIELVTLRVQGEGRVPQATVTTLSPLNGTLPQPKGCRKLLFNLDDGWADCLVYERASLGRGVTLRGPIVVEDKGASIPILPRHGLSVDAFGDLLIDTALA
jgi:N-methylhydantoinase A